MAPVFASGPSTCAQCAPPSRVWKMPRSAFGFFFRAEAGIRAGRVTGVQTCALPISEERSELQSSGAHVLEQDRQRDGRVLGSVHRPGQPLLAAVELARVEVESRSGG